MPSMSLQNAKYTTAGHFIYPDKGIGVRANVWLPGGQYTAELQEDGFHAPDQAAPVRKREKLQVPRWFTLAVCIIAFIIFFSVIISKAAYNHSLVGKINDTQRLAEEHERALALAQLQLEEKGSRMSICYRAVQEYGMITSAGAESYYIRYDQARGGIVADSGLFGVEARAAR